MVQKNRVSVRVSYMISMQEVLYFSLYCFVCELRHVAISLPFWKEGLTLDLVMLMVLILEHKWSTDILNACYCCERRPSKHCSSGIDDVHVPLVLDC